MVVIGDKLLSLFPTYFAETYPTNNEHKLKSHPVSWEVHSLQYNKEIGDVSAISSAAFRPPVRKF